MFDTKFILIIGFIFIALAIFTAAFGPKGKSGRKGDYRYKRKNPLFTAAERSFLGVLDNVLPDQYRVLGMVRIADLISVVGRNRQSGFNRISAKHFDFVICNKDDLSVVGAIELNDISHKQKKRIDRDQLIEEVCKEAGLPLILINAQRSYQPEEILNRIKTEFSI